MVNYRSRAPRGHPLCGWPALPNVSMRAQRLLQRPTERDERFLAWDLTGKRPIRKLHGVRLTRSVTRPRSLIPCSYLCGATSFSSAAVEGNGRLKLAGVSACFVRAVSGDRIHSDKAQGKYAAALAQARSLLVGRLLPEYIRQAYEVSSNLKSVNSWINQQLEAYPCRTVHVRHLLRSLLSSSNKLNPRVKYLLESRTTTTNNPCHSLTDFLTIFAGAFYGSSAA
ncbi:hypothetical protein G7K_0313-t1 [Saitoella complicata NRRL Y-17804]|uniref:Uncharacterized protein n=1 Tax=Saitoella complicata (strain BCRC 22490 / CBS 7301 / JCM 7358 / NBRC 10748 / NRRL Y-17804) TaxID=698492 RepID=A0A0E9N9I3_SAICN|nr:hypothetical protein G7K_0313-t1 [Saitoella complicata NRRL Y-17804]